MRRKDREVQNIQEIFDILMRCDTIRIGISGDPFPYIVPVSFGAQLIDGKVTVYFHCAKEGLKLDLLKRNPQVCAEGDIFIQTETTAHGITTRYESVIGRGTFHAVEEKEEILHGLSLLLEHYGYPDYPLEHCGSLNSLLVGKIVLDEISGKRNLPGSLTSADLARLNRP